MGKELYNLKISDPHLAFDANWKALDTVQGITRVEEFHIKGLDVYSRGDYRSVPEYCASLFEAQPSIAYPRCTALVEELTPLVRGNDAAIIKAHDGPRTELLALSPSQARVLRSGLLYSDLAKHLGTFNRTLIALEDALQEQSQLESLVEDEVPKERGLYLLGSRAGENFRYTVSRYGDRLGHDLVTMKKPLKAVAEELEGNALYQVQRIPTIVSQKVEDFRRFLLSQYISIKRQISREKLPVYPLLFPTNS